MQYLFSMKKLIVITAFIIAAFSSCGPSEQKRQDANDVYSETLGIINEVNTHDSEYVYCMQYLLREIQSPDLKKNKKKLKSITDSISLLDAACDSLAIVIAEAKTKTEKLNVEKPDMELTEAADSLLSKYNTITQNIYQDINQKMKKISLPVKDSEYTALLRLSYRADSVLNAAVTNFNTESAAFYEKYGLKDLKK